MGEMKEKKGMSSIRHSPFWQKLRENHLLLPANMKSARLKEFRQAAYTYLGKAHDATFELTDAILLTRNVYCLADLS